LSYSSADSDNNWDIGGAVSTDPYAIAYNRANRWFARARLSKGLNTAFELDDLIIEHAHGTSNEANGFYEIDDWPDPESISWRRVDPDPGSNRLANGSLKINSAGDRRPRYAVSADFVNTTTTIYDDINAIVTQQKNTGDMVVFRPYGTVLPPVMVGKLRISPRSPRHWDLGRTSFTIEFEEA